MTPLTPREREVSDLVCAGYDVEEISAILTVGVWTVKRHVKLIRAKCGANTMRDIPAALARTPPT